MEHSGVPFCHHDITDHHSIVGFISLVSSFSVRSSETEGCRSNCIYFVHKKRYCSSCIWDDGNTYTWGVYSMEDRVVLFEHDVTGPGPGPCSSATWFLPSVARGSEVF
jgi:hypothetical protein